ncbi:MAG: tRNA glutamyl-Q(34) synthetase GluQRS [Gemmataceae bacterium]|nr:tRNA glutamyl-Q(34) synthetase GluQRS [Gemmataceae bacterium]
MVVPPPTGRLAPSPTGAQHVGNARTYLVAWLSARARGGSVRVRIEDIDSPRIKPGAAQSAVEDLKWLGLDWDGEIVTQTDRLSHYESALEVLKRSERVYPCTCTRSDIAAAASAPHEGRRGSQGEPAGGFPSPGEEITYPGTCAHRSVADSLTLVEERKPFAWRFRVAESPSFTDLFAGEQHVDLKHAGGDFVVWKKPGGGSGGNPHGVTPPERGEPAYQLAVVVDDAAMGVTEVVRGDDLIPSTPRQLLLYQALGLKPPAFAHVPLVVGEDGRRLAKRHGDTRLSTLRAAGVTPEALVGLLAWACGWGERAEPVAARELLSRFDLARVPRGPFVLTSAALRAIGYAGGA